MILMRAAREVTALAKELVSFFTSFPLRALNSHEATHAAGRRYFFLLMRRDATGKGRGRGEARREELGGGRNWLAD